MILPVVIAVLAVIFVGALIGLSLTKNEGKSTTQNRYAKPKRRAAPKESKVVHSPKAQTRQPAKVEPVVARGNAKEPLLKAQEDDVDSILGLKSTASQPMSNQEQPSLQAKPAADNQRPISKIIVVHLTADKARPYSGYELLQSLLAIGMRYGDMHIFHRHEYKTGRGKVLFSLASSTKPGTFDLPKMGSFRCEGLTLFMDITKCDNPLDAFSTMLDTVGSLVDDLGGVVLDEQRNTLTKNKVVMIRKDIRALQEAQRVPDMFEEMTEA